MVGVCSGLNVVEVGSASIAASMAGMVLADAGARVIKVERPGGDRLRIDHPNGFRIWNRGKESVVADLRVEDGRRTFEELARAADVVIEGFAPGTTERWGVGADALRALNPRLVHCRITGFGMTGPLAGIKGYDSIVAARAGVWARGDFGHRPGAIYYPVPWASFGAAMQAVGGIAGALVERERSGRGQVVDATLFAGLEPLDYLLSVVMQVAAKQAKEGHSSGGGAPPSRYGVLLVTKDGRIVQTSTLLSHQARALCEVAGVVDILDEPRFAKAPMFDTVDDAQAFEEALLEAFRQEDLDHWMPRLLASPDVAFEVAVTSEQGLDHPQIIHNGDVVTVDDPEVGPIREVGPVGHFSATPMSVERSAPALDQHDGPLVPASSSNPVADAVSGRPPLDGVTIVDFGYFYAMPYALACAAALGARVIKLEDGNGDPHRRAWGADTASAKTMAGKESVSLDLRSERGQEAARRIAAGADVFVTGFRAGVADKLGLGEERLRALNPRLLYVHGSGYGKDGPYAHRALYAQAAQSVAGSFGRQVAYWAEPSRNVDMSQIELQVVVLPRLAQVIDGDSNGALALFAALLLGVYHQQRTGEGQTLSTSMIAGNAWAYSDDFCQFEGKEPVRHCDEEYFGTSALDRVYAAADGTWLCLHVPSDDEFAALAKVIEAPLDDDRFGDAAARAEHDGALVEALSGAFATRPADVWEQMLSAVGVGCAQVSMTGQPATIAFDPVLRDAGLTTTYEHPLYGELVRFAPHLRYSESPVVVAPPSLRGQHNRSVLAAVGYSDDELDALEHDGVIFPPDPR